MLLSDLQFGAFLSYSPRDDTSAEGRKSRAVRKAVKNDLPLDGRPILPFSVARLREELTPDREVTPDLLDLLAQDVVLVPMPGSAPLPPKDPDALWVPRRICEELVKAQFGARWEPLLVRRVAVPKSSTAAQEGRPRTDLQTHYDSLAVSPRLGDPPMRITLVDDFITKGATVLAGASRLAEAFPNAEIRAFALVRTQYGGKHVFRAIVDPVYNRVSNGPYGAWRQDDT